MRNIISVVLAGTLVAGCAINLDKIGEQSTDTSALSWQELVEREIRKQDPWVEWYIDSDYTNSNREGHVSLRILPRSRLEKLLEGGRLKFSGSYNPESDFLILPEPLNETEREKSLDGVDHEVFHSLYDAQKIKGILHSPNYVGPSLQEIAEYATKRTNGTEFATLRNELRLQEELQGLSGLSERFLFTFGKGLIKAFETYQQASRYIQEHEELEEFVTDAERDAFLSQQRDLYEKLVAYMEDFSRVRDWAGEWFSSIKAHEEVTLEDIRVGKDKLRELGQELETYGDLAKQARTFRTTVMETYAQAEDRQYAKRIEEAKKEGDNKLAEAFQQLRDAAKFSSGVSKIIDTLGDFDLAGSIQSMLKQLTYQDNAYKIDQILNDPNEVMARVVDSLYSLYFGPVSQTKFPLTEQDLFFLEQFKVVRDGKEIPLFRKGIEKYQVGIQMIADGHKPEDVKEQLEYATSFTYKGKKYHWPEARFTIKGTIPNLEPVSELLQP